MKSFTLFVRLITASLALFFAQFLFGQSVIDPNDAIINYDVNNPPIQPPSGQIGKWVRTKRLPWNTDAYKAYIYKGSAFRLKFPRTYSTNNDGRRYPMIIMFHGRGEAGPNTDNEYSMYHGGELHLNAVNNGTFDGFVFFMQGGTGWGTGQFAHVAEVIDYMVTNNKLDPFRINVHGLSAGGDGAWNFAANFPRYVSGLLPMSGTNIAFRENSIVQSLKFTPIWDFQGELDGSPSPWTSQQVYLSYVAAGANMKHTVYPHLGHTTWPTAYAESDFFPFMVRSNKANPWPLFGKSEFCPGETINVTLGVTPGFTSYEWRKNGVLISGATGNTYQATTEGIYSCRILRGTLWSEWSPTPVVVGYKSATVSPPISVKGLMSKVLPALDNNSLILSVPSNYATYLWQKVGSTTTLSTADTLVVSSPGEYRVRVTEQFGCSSEFSAPFSVVDANGPNKPDPAINLVVTPLSKTSLQLNWSDNPTPVYDETAFEVYKSDAPGGPYRLAAIKGANVHAHVVEDLNSNSSYYFRIRAVNNTGAAAPSVEATGKTLADNQPPDAPTNLTITGSTRTSISLAWSEAYDDVGVTKYDIYIDGSKAYVTEGTSFTVYGLTTGRSYNFSVKARDFENNVSPASNQVTGQPLFRGLNYKHYTFTGTWNNLPNFNTLTPVATGIMPAVALTPRVQDDNFAFLWEGFINIPVNGTYTFRTRSDDGSRLWLGAHNGTESPYNFSGTPLVNNDGLHGAQDRDGTITLSAGTYPIAIAFYEQGGSEVMTVSWRTPQTGSSFVAIPASAFADPPVNNGSAPDAPANLAAVSVSYKQINLTWADKSDNETGFEIWRSTDAFSDFTTVGVAPANATSYTDSSVASSTKYFYKVRAIGSYGESEFTYNYTEAHWDFDNNYNDATGNDRALSPNGGPTFDANDKMRGTHSLVLSGSNNRYVTISNSGNFLQEAYSERTIAFWMKSNSNANNRIVFEVGGSDDGIALRLNSNTLIAGIASNNSRHTIQASYNNSNWRHIAVVYKGNTFRLYIDGTMVAANNNLPFTALTTTSNGARIGLTNGSNAFNSTSGYNLYNGKIDGFGIYATALSPEAINALRSNTFGQSNAVTHSLPEVPAAATGLVASGTSLSSIQVTWTDNANSETGYEIYRSNNNNGNYLLAATLPANTTSYVDEGLFANVIAYYKVRAINAGGASAFSNEDSASTWNNIPVLQSLANQQMRYGTTLQLEVTATDADPGNLTLSVANLPSFGTFVQTGNGQATLSFNPTQSSHQGLYNDITITVTDQNNGSVSSSFNLVVNSNYSPAIGVVSNVVMKEGESTQINLSATDENPTDILSWTFTGLPSFATLDTTAGSAQITLAPTYTDHGVYTVSAAVSDGNGGTSSRSFTITVTDVIPEEIVYIHPTRVGAQFQGPSPWNNLNKVPALNDVFSDLKDHLGRTSSIGLKITSNWAAIGDGTNTTGTVTGNNSGVYPDNVLRSSYYTNAAAQTIQIYGLNPAGKYNFTLFGTRQGTDNRTAAYTIKGVTLTLNAASNTQNTVTFNDVIPDADGTLVLTLARASGSSAAYLNALVIEKVTGIVPSAPARPRNVNAEIVGADVKISWVDAAYNETGYQVYRATSLVGPYTLLNSTPTQANAQEYIDGTVSGNTLYYYSVKAFNELGEAYSDTISVTTANTSPNLQAIADVNMVTGQVVNVNVSATDNPGDIITLSVTNLPPFATFTTTGNGTGVINITAGYTTGTFQCTVTATDNYGAAASTQFNIVVAPVDPNAPTELVAGAISKSSIRLTWKDNASSESGFQVHRASSANGTYSLVATLPANTTTYDNTGLSNGSTYYYKVRAVIGGNFTSYTNTAGSTVAQSQVYVNFGDENIVPLPWNNTPIGPIDGDVMALKNDLGNPTNMTMVVVGQGWSGVNHTGMNTGNNSGVVPDDVMKYNWFLNTGTVGIVKFTGLDMSKTYGFTIFGSRDGNGQSPNRSTSYTIGSQTVVLNCVNNISKTVRIEGVRPDEDGSITMETRTAETSTAGYLGSVIYQAYTTDNPSSGGVQTRRREEVTQVSQQSNEAQVKSDVTQNVSINAYPNPFVDEVTLNIVLKNGVEKLTVFVTDMNGRNVFVNKLERLPAGSSQIKLRLNNQPAGVYIISIVDNTADKPRYLKILKGR